MRNRSGRSRERVGRDPRGWIGNAVLAALDPRTTQTVAGADRRPAPPRADGRSFGGTRAARTDPDPDEPLVGGPRRRDRARDSRSEHLRRAPERVDGAGARLGGALDRQARSRRANGSAYS